MSGAADILGGAAEGAAAGSVGGVPGAIIGGIVGAIGGLFKSKAKKNAREASKEEQKMARRKIAMQRRELVRQAYISRAQTVAAAAAEEGGLTSSAPLGALASVTSQATGNINYFDAQAASSNRIVRLTNKASKYAGFSDAISGAISAVSSAYKPNSKSFEPISEVTTTARKLPMPSPVKTYPYDYGSVTSGPL